MFRCAKLTLLFSLFIIHSVYSASFSKKELAYMPASVQLQLFQARVISPVDVLNAQIEQIETYNEQVNCITYTHFEEALKQARESEERYRNGTARPLEGITVAVKDEHGMKGWVMTQGSVLLKNNRLKETDPMAERLSKAGAILHIQTTVPEFYLHGVTFTKLWGVTRNPWNLNYAVGGSSGGSGAALAAGFATLATGSDMGGSLRIPAAFDGVYTFKPPYGRVPTEWPLVPISGSGPMARTFEDMVRMYNVIIGPHETSPTTIRQTQDVPLSFPSIKGMKIAYTVNLGWMQIDESTKKHFLKAVEVLRTLGAEVEEVKLELGLDDNLLSKLFEKAALSGPMGALLLQNKDRLDEMTPYAAYFTKKGIDGDFGSETSLDYQNGIIDLHKKFEDQVWKWGYRVFLMPTLATSNVPADYDFSTDQMEINGVNVHPVVGWILTPIFNILNWYPVTNVPIGLNENRVPIGMQIIGNAYDDLPTFQVAWAYSRAGVHLFTGDQFPDYR